MEIHQFYSREKIAVHMKINPELIQGSELVVGREGEDFILEQLTAQLSVNFLARKKETRKEIYTFEPPTFLDWLLRRRRAVEVHLNVKELLKTPTPVAEVVVDVTFEGSL